MIFYLYHLVNTRIWATFLSLSVLFVFVEHVHNTLKTTKDRFEYEIFNQLTIKITMNTFYC